MKVRWSDRALKTLADLHAWLAVESEQSANDTVDRLLRRGDQLASFPNSGRIVSHYNRPDIRELVERPYRIIYRIRRSDVQIIDVFHSAQQPPWQR
jgi:plasmid stabilization system protein ParE